jgi:16S rRNA G1207 methylase RsmC
VHIPANGRGAVFWARRSKDRPRRRHEMVFQVSQGEEKSLRFVSRPGVFSYGRFDNGARALMEVAQIEEGDKILDLGCGCGTNGVIAGLRAGPKGKVAFLDSNVRAVALAGTNAKANGLENFELLARSGMEGVAEKAFDVVLANPPYFAQNRIARMFIEESRSRLRRDGRLYLVSKQPAELVDMVGENYREAQIVEHRGYSVFVCEGPIR